MTVRSLIDEMYRRRLARVIEEMRFDPDQPRDETGKWSSGGGGGGASAPIAIGAIVAHPINSQAAAQTWGNYAQSQEIRYAAETMLGQDHPAAREVMTEGLGAQPEVLDALDHGRLEDGSRTRTQEAVDSAASLLRGVRDADRTTVPLMRAVPVIESDPGGPELLALKTGSEFDLSLASFTDIPQMAESFTADARIPQSGYTDIMFVLEPGARAMRVEGTEDEYQGQNGTWQRGNQDIISGGRFVVTDVIQQGTPDEPKGTADWSDFREIHIKQVGVFDPDAGGKLVTK